MNYLTARTAFLKSCGNPDGEEKLRVIAAFDKTISAKHARFLDAWANFGESVRKTFFWWM